MTSVQAAIAKIVRIIKNIISRGELLELTYEDLKVPTAKVSQLAGEIAEGVEFAQSFGFKSWPPKGSETLTLFFAGERNHSTIIRMFHRDKYGPIIEEGESAQYNDSGMSLVINNESEIVVTKAADPDDEESVERSFKINFSTEGDITITATTNIIIDTPLVTMTGDLVVDGTINGE